MSPLTERVVGPAVRTESPTRKRRGFTLVELLVSMSVLLLVMVITAQLVGRTTSITTASNKLMDTATMARTVFDRLNNDLAGAALYHGPTILYSNGSSGTSSGSTIDPVENSSLGFVCKSRARKLTNDKTSSAILDVRGIVVGYKIRPTAITLHYGSTVNIPLMNRGEATLTFLATGTFGSNGKYGSNIWDMFGLSSTTSLPKDLSSATADDSLLAWQGLGDGVMRMHVSFVLDDGRIVQTLQQGASPNYTLNLTTGDFKTNGGTGTNCYPVAFSAVTTSDPNRHYVTGMLVGIAVLDTNTLAVAYAQNPTFAASLASQLKRPVNDGETPLRIWQANLNAVTPLPVQRSLRFYQRFYAFTP